ncbi:hypothetical protein SLEP1_g37175 [Rubroshorea leprosula]|uniref:Uncharacterized protein n=1 Tax=Rubroshorea leprosula TaxID=152421 RepID=A0AAV5KU29_9ROSI|nr:hypothetical protein SLEP1_g37175 [Rubroshorea leprosula]
MAVAPTLVHPYLLNRKKGEGGVQFLVSTRKCTGKLFRICMSGTQLSEVLYIQHF